jgi:hypothetical protein
MEETTAFVILRQRVALQVAPGPDSGGSCGRIEGDLDMVEAEVDLAAKWKHL